ncbi:terminase [Mycobacterium phage ScoobyDoobyDoo]|nr:terminase [Mycobacterium phage ScoobyDoobyDoo]
MARNITAGSEDAFFDPIAQFQNSLRNGPPWESIVDFATHRSFCGMQLYPRQLTLLKLIYLETEMFTDFDYETINQWAQGFKDRTRPMGVQPDIFDRIDYLKSHGYHHFPHVQTVMGRRASKGIIGGITGAERLAYFFSLDDWQRHFGIVPNAMGELTVIATTQAQAADRQFGDIRRTVEQCEYLKPHIVANRVTDFYIRTPADERHIDEMRMQGISLDREFATLHASAAATSSTSKRGGNGFANYYDEFAHQIMGTGSTKSGDEVYAAMQPSLDQFGIQRFTYVPSSPFTKVGRFYQLYQEGCVTMDVYNEREGKFERRSFTEKHMGMDMDEVEEELDVAIADPEMLVVQLPSWETYRNWDIAHTIPMRPGKKRTFPKWKRPVQWDPDGESAESKSMARIRVKNPEKFKVERAAQFASVEDAYLNEVMVDRMFEKPWWRDELVPQDKGKFSIVYRAHGDPSRTNANFGFAIGHIEDAPCDGCGWDPNNLPPGTPPQAKYNHNCKLGGRVLPHVIFDKLHVWQPEKFPDHTVNYVQVGQDIDQFLRKYPSIDKLTYDQYAAFGLVDQQRLDHPHMHIYEKTFTVQENQRRFERFKAAINLGLVHAYRDDFFDDGMSLLEQELKFLQEKNGKVDRQEIGPVTTKDLSDCVMVVAVDLLEDHLERWYKGRTRASFGSTNTAGLKSGREQERMALTGVGNREAPQDIRSVRARANRHNLERFNADRSDRRERGFGSIARDPFVPANARRSGGNRYTGTGGNRSRGRF